MDWWIDRADVGSRFCFEDAKAKEAFALTCDSFGIPSSRRLAESTRRPVEAGRGQRHQCAFWDGSLRHWRPRTWGRDLR